MTLTEIIIGHIVLGFAGVLVVVLAKLFPVVASTHSDPAGYEEWKAKTLQKIRDGEKDREIRRQARIFAEEFQKRK